MRFSQRRHHRLPAATGLVAVLALTATVTACDSGDDEASEKPGSAASRTADRDGDGVPDVLADKLQEYGIDVVDWKDGGWKDRDKDPWLSEAKDFVNPVIDGLWDAERMRGAEEPAKTVSTQDASADQVVSDPVPAPVQAAAVTTPFAPLRMKNRPGVGSRGRFPPSGGPVA